jgi:hypothetical protein
VLHGHARSEEQYMVMNVELLSFGTLRDKTEKSEVQILRGHPMKKKTVMYHVEATYAVGDHDAEDYARTLKEVNHLDISNEIVLNFIRALHKEKYYGDVEITVMIRSGRETTIVGKVNKDGRLAGYPEALGKYTDALVRLL